MVVDIHVFDPDEPEATARRAGARDAPRGWSYDALGTGTEAA